MNPAEFPVLAKAVNRWLSYQLLCGRKALLSESYLGHPLAEFLLFKHPWGFDAEVNHPVLNHPRPGRPRQIDYALFTPHTKLMNVAIECKWVADRPYDKQRILNDLLRLECVRVGGLHVKRYFLVAGRQANFDSKFRDLAINTGGAQEDFTKTLLDFLPGQWKTIQVRDCIQRFRPFYEAFHEAFNAEVPKSFKTKLLVEHTEDEIAVYIWEVASARNRSHFSPQLQWQADAQ